MPALPSTTILGTFAPGNFIQTALEAFVSPGLGYDGPGVSTFGILAVDGHPAIFVENTNDSPEYNFVTVVPLESVSDTTGCPPGILLIAQGVSQTVSIPANPGLPPWEEFVHPRWIEFLDDAMIPFMEGVCGSTVTLVEEWSTYDEEHNRGRLLAVMRHTMESQEVYYHIIGVAVGGAWSDPAFTPSAFGRDVGSFPCFGEAGQPVSTSNQLERIAEAVEEMANQETDVSINHGQAIFSAKSKVTTGP